MSDAGEAVTGAGDGPSGEAALPPVQPASVRRGLRIPLWGRLLIYGTVQIGSLAMPLSLVETRPVPLDLLRSIFLGSFALTAAVGLLLRILGGETDVSITTIFFELRLCLVLFLLLAIGVLVPVSYYHGKLPSLIFLGIFGGLLSTLYARSYVAPPPPP